MIDAHTRMVGLIGWPVVHSLSPTMHNAAFDALGLNWRYVPLPVPEGQVEAAVRGIAALGFRGVNVTVPHKQAVVPLLDDIAPNARELRAVNTIVVEEAASGATGIKGYNTDDGGVIAALRQGGYEPCDGRLSIIVGAGGAARAVVHGLLRSGTGEIVVLNRTPSRAEALICDLRACGGDARLRAVQLTPNNLLEWAPKADLLVNATTVGMWPRVEASIWPHSAPVPKHLTVFDLVYNPLETRLLQQVRSSGAWAIEGLDMLVAQGAEAFELWTGRKAPIRVMRAACERSLKR